MSKKIVSIWFLFVACCTIFGSIFIWAQQAQKERKSYTGTAFLDDKVTSTGKISVADFLKLLDKPLWVKDKRDNSMHPALVFVYTYAERAMYEDETGKPMIVTDYLSTNVKGTVDTTTMFEMKYRAKAGDTAFFESIEFFNNDQKDKQGQAAEPIKLILTQ